MKREFRRAIAALPEQQAALQVELAAFLDDAELGATTRHAVELVCDELLNNALRHGVRDGDGGAHRIELSIALAATVAIRIRDDLAPFDPTAVAPPASPRDLAAAPIGGRGLALVRRFSRVFRWHADHGCNVVDVEIERDCR